MSYVKRKLHHKNRFKQQKVHIKFKFTQMIQNHMVFIQPTNILSRVWKSIYIFKLSPWQLDLNP